MDEDGAEHGNSSQRSNVSTTAVKDGQAGAAISISNAKIENLSINNNQQGSVVPGHSRQVTEIPDGYTKAVQITLRGGSPSTITIQETILVHNGKVSILGTYDDQNVQTTATCEGGRIVHLEAVCGKQPTTDTACRTKCTLSVTEKGALSRLMENCFKGLRDITCAFIDRFRVRWMHAEEGSLVFKFGHGTKQDAEEMVYNEVEVIRLLKKLLGNYNIHVHDVEVIVECDDVAELPSTSTDKGGERIMEQHDATSQSDSGISTVTGGGLQLLVKYKGSIDEEVDGCVACRNIREIKDPNVATNQVVIHIDVVKMSEKMLRSGRDPREYRQKKRIEMSKKASALRNSGGGAIFCHLSGKNKINRCLRLFDDMFLKPQIFCLGEGEIYSNEIQREWFEDTDFLVITVSQYISTSVCTASVNSYTSNHSSLAAASLPEIKTLLFGKRDVGHRRPVVRGLKNLQAGVDIKLKHSQPTEHFTIEANISEYFYTYGLHRYISAFSKNRPGGSFYIGVREGEICPIMEGVHITSKDHTTFTETLRHFVRQNLMIIPNIHTHESYDLTDVVDVTFHQVSEDKSVIEVSVRPVNGCVFTDKGGPSAYKLDEKGDLRRMTCEEWMQKIQPVE